LSFAKARKLLIVGMILSLLGLFIPYVSLPMSVIGFIVFAIGVYEIREYNNFWNYFLATYLGILVSFIGVIVFVFGVLPAIVDNQNMFLSEHTKVYLEQNNINYNKIDFSKVIIGVVLTLIGIIITTVFKYKYLNEFFKITGIIEFKWSKLFLIIGFITIPVLIGFFLIIVSLLLELLGYIKMREGSFSTK